MPGIWLDKYMNNKQIKLEKEYENLIDYDDEGNSNCCNAPIIRGFCSACKEHTIKNPTLNNKGLGKKYEEIQTN